MVYLGEEKLPVTDGEEGGVGEASFTAGDTEGGVEERTTELEGAASSESPEKEEVKLFVWVCLTAQSTWVKLSLLVHAPATQGFVQTEPRGQLAHQLQTGFVRLGTRQARTLTLLGVPHMASALLGLSQPILSLLHSHSPRISYRESPPASNLGTLRALPTPSASTTKASSPSCWPFRMVGALWLLHAQICVQPRPQESGFDTEATQETTPTQGKQYSCAYGRRKKISSH